MEKLTELELFILQTISRNSNKLPTHADYASMKKKAGGDEARVANALEALALKGFLSRSGIERGADGFIQASLSAMRLTQAGEQALEN